MAKSNNIPPKHTLTHQKVIGKHVTTITLNPLETWNIPKKQLFQNFLGGDLRNKNTPAPELQQSIEKNLPTYSNISERCLLCMHKKLSITTLKYQENLLNKRSKLMNKCHHENKFLLSNYNSNFWFCFSREHNIIWRFLYCNRAILF